MNIKYSKKKSIALLLFSNIFYIKYFLIKPSYIILILYISMAYARGKYVLYRRYMFVCVLFQLFLISHMILYQSDIGMILNANLAILSFPVIYHYLNFAKIDSVKFFLNMSILFFLVEAFWRVTHPIYIKDDGNIVWADEEGWFYPYKFSSFIFQDSNFVALHLFCLMAISLFLNMKKRFILFYLLILLTFSRSAILVSSGLIIFFIYRCILHSKYKYHISMACIVAIMGFLGELYMNLQTYFIGIILDDGSFLSKFSIIDSALQYAKNNFSIVEYLFGIGLANSFSYIGRGAHNIGVILLFETGIIGSVIYITYFLVFIFSPYTDSKNTRNKYLLFILSFFSMGFSLGLYLFPVMTVTIALILQSNKLLTMK